MFLCLPFLFAKPSCFVFQIARNITTNEMSNAMRYSYLRGPGGRFQNPYDHGIRKNCSDFLFKGYNEDVELLDQTPASQELGMIQMTRSPNAQNGENHSQQVNNGHACADIQAKDSKHVNHSKCCNNNNKSNGAPLGLGLGFGLGRSNRHNTRILPLWYFILQVLLRLVRHVS